MSTIFDQDPWVIRREGFDAASLRESESVLALGNGFIGMRGNLEELTADGASTVQGTYLNGVFESAPITGADFFSLSGCCLFPAFTLK